jgi:hypothetical protein
VSVKIWLILPWVGKKDYRAHELRAHPNSFWAARERDKGPSATSEARQRKIPTHLFSTKNTQARPGAPLPPSPQEAHGRRRPRPFCHRRSPRPICCAPSNLCSGHPHRCQCRRSAQAVGTSPPEPPLQRRRGGHIGFRSGGCVESRRGGRGAWEARGIQCLFSPDGASPVAPAQGMLKKEAGSNECHNEWQPAGRGRRKPRPALSRSSRVE